MNESDRYPEREGLETLINAVPDALCIMTTEWRIAWANREFSRMAGMTRSAVGTSIGDFVESWPSILPGIVQTLEREGRARRHVVFLRADGGAIQSVLHLAAGPSCRTACIHDADEVTHLRQELSDRERSHSFLRAHTSDMIIRTNADLTITWCNDAAAPTFRPGTSLPGMLSEEARERLVALVGEEDQAAERHDVAFDAHENHRPLFFLRGTLRRLRDEQGHFAGISVILSDDSENRRFTMLATRLAMTPREQEVVQYLLQGYSNLNIAAILGLSESGVKFHIRNVYTRARVNSRTELMAMLLGG